MSKNLFKQFFAMQISFKNFGPSIKSAQYFVDLQIDNVELWTLEEEPKKPLSTHQGAGNLSDLRHWVVNRNDLSVENIRGFLSPPVDIRASRARQKIAWLY